ncbi:MAG: ATP-binding protein [Elusimicrobiota bacterium]
MPETPDASSLEAALKLMAPIISHEIRNPLAVIGNSSYFVKTKLVQLGTKDAKIEKHLGIIAIELKRANDVLCEILAYARMKTLSLHPLPLNGLVTDGINDLEVPDSVRVRVSPAPENPIVLADAELVCAAIRHVVRNAVEAAGLTKDGGGVQVAIKVEDGKWGVVEVTDAGAGVPPEEREKLFTPFHTTRPRGIGLGLAFARKVIESLDGRVEFVAPDGPGARFRLLLPKRP